METSATKKFNCPSCAAPLDYHGGDAATMLCPYCSQSVIVPRELRSAPRPAPANPTPTVNVIVQNNAPADNSWYAQQRAQGRSIFSIALVFLVVVVAGFAMRESIPRWLANVTGSQAIANVIPSGPAKIETTFGGAGTGTGLFQEPRLVAADGKGFSYVLDSTKRVQRFDAQGMFVNFWTIEGKDAFNTDFTPQELAADRAGNVYVMSSLSIRKYDGASGKLLQTIRNEKITQRFSGFALTADGGLVALAQEVANDVLIWYDASGKVTKHIDKPLSKQLDKNVFLTFTDAIAVDGLGNVFVLHDEMQQGVFVYKFTRDGNYVSRFGGKGDKEGQLDSARHIAVDDQSRVYVSGQKHIQRFDTDGRFLDWMPNTLVGNYTYDFALADKNIMYAIGMDSQVYKLVWSDPR